MNVSSVADGIQEVQLVNWNEFSEFVSERLLRRATYVFRGQTHYEWPLVSSLDRLEQHYPPNEEPADDNPESVESPPLSEERHLDAFKRAVAGRRGGNPPPLTVDQYWALGQHHGLATPLLDWTRSPFVAMFFAFEDEAQPEPPFRGVYALSTRAIEDGSPHSQATKIISIVSDDNRRLIHQGGLFLKMPRHTDLESYIRQRFAGEERRAILIRVAVPSEGRHGCLTMLNKMNINRMTLFPDIEGAAQYVNSLWQPGQADSIAFV